LGSSAQAQTIEQQLERLRAHAAARGWKLAQERAFRDDGYNGTSLIGQLQARLPLLCDVLRQLKTHARTGHQRRPTANGYAEHEEHSTSRASRLAGLR
jgi:hypothetical protein